MFTLKFAGLAALQEMYNQNEARYAKKTDIKEYSISRLDTAEEGYAASYQLVDGTGTEHGVKINIPRDYLVRSAQILTVEEADKPVEGYAVGEKYIDFVVNTADNDGTASHIYLAVNELVDVYTEGNGIDISDANVVSVAIDSENANGLSVGANGLALGLASATSAGALSAADYNKFNNAAEANLALGEATGEGNVVTSLSVNASGELVADKGITAVQESDLVEITAAEVQSMYSGSSSGGSDPSDHENNGGNTDPEGP